MEKFFYSCPDFNTFKTLKLSTNTLNNKYKLYEASEELNGTPDILYNQIVFILEECIIYCRGKIIYNLSELLDILKDIESTTSRSLLNLNDRIKITNNNIDQAYDQLILNHNTVLDIVAVSQLVQSKALNEMNERIGHFTTYFTAEDEEVINGQKQVTDIKSSAIGLCKILEDNNLSYLSL